MLVPMLLAAAAAGIAVVQRTVTLDNNPTATLDSNANLVDAETEADDFSPQLAAMQGLGAATLLGGSLILTTRILAPTLKHSHGISSTAVSLAAVSGAAAVGAAVYEGVRRAQRAGSKSRMLAAHNAETEDVDSIIY